MAKVRAAAARAAAAATMAAMSGKEVDAVMADDGAARVMMEAVDRVALAVARAVVEMVMKAVMVGAGEPVEVMAVCMYVTWRQ